MTDTASRFEPPDGGLSRVLNGSVPHSERAAMADALRRRGAFVPDVQPSLIRSLIMKMIAVVEDNPDNRLLVRALLEDRYRITEYETGKDALEGIGNDIPDLVLLDISLPGMDGMEVLRALRDDETIPRLPVIALTAHAMTGDRERFLAAGFDDYITKPIVDEDLLLSAIDNHVHD